MSKQPDERSRTEEVDLGYLFSSIGRFFKRCIRLLYQILMFYRKYWIATLVLILIGIGWGIYKDRNVLKPYDNELIVIPNFESADYLYDAVEAINTKIKEGHLGDFKEVFGDDIGKLAEVEIEPIPDIYNYISLSEERVNVFRTLFQNQELDKFIEERHTAKFYKYHRLTVTTRGEGAGEEMVKKLLQYLNMSEHYARYKKETRQNTRFQLEQNEVMIAQVDSLLIAFAHPERSAPLVFMSSDQTELGGLIETKERLLKDRLELQKKLVDEVDIIKLAAASYNVPAERGLMNLSNKVKWPLLLVLLFSGIFLIRNGWRRMKEIGEA